MIGRKTEFEKLQSAMDKDRAQLIAVYGRRRVGKTFLINEFFEGKFIFKHTAVSPVDDVTKKRKKKHTETAASGILLFHADIWNG